MEAKFTKGPWVLVDRGAWFEIDSTGGENIANSGGFDPDHTGFNCCDEMAANAHLIKAAPKMYKFLDDLANGRGTDYPIEKLLAEARGE